jgi:hypothetical protein
MNFFVEHFLNKSAETKLGKISARQFIHLYTEEAEFNREVLVERQRKGKKQLHQMADGLKFIRCCGPVIEYPQNSGKGVVWFVKGTKGYDNAADCFHGVGVAEVEIQPDGSLHASRLGNVVFDARNSPL